LLGGAAAGIEQGLKQAGSIQRGQELLVQVEWRPWAIIKSAGVVPYPSPAPAPRSARPAHPLDPASAVSDLEALRLEEADEGHFLTIGADVLASERQ